MPRASRSGAAPSQPVPQRAEGLQPRAFSSGIAPTRPCHAGDPGAGWGCHQGQAEAEILSLSLLPSVLWVQHSSSKPCCQWQMCFPKLPQRENHLLTSAGLRGTSGAHKAKIAYRFGVFFLSDFKFTTVCIFLLKIAIMKPLHLVTGNARVSDYLCKTFRFSAAEL